MPLCCRCTDSGHCRNCICVRSGCPCFNCIPKQKGSCVNCQHTDSESESEPATDREVDDSDPYVSPLDSDQDSFDVDDGDPYLSPIMSLMTTILIKILWIHSYPLTLIILPQCQGFQNSLTPQFSLWRKGWSLPHSGHQ